MPIDLATAMNRPLQPSEHSWDEDAIILYHLGLGAGADWLNPKELSYTYEKHLQVLPSYAALPTLATVAPVTTGPGLEFPPYDIVHGEHEIELFKPIPTAGTAITETRLIGVYEKGSGALAVIEHITRLQGEDAILFKNRWSLFVRGQQGVGKEPDPRPVVAMPDRDADWVVESPIIPQLAQIYRLSGDKTEFHIDPDIARAAGFAKPLLHGLCTFGVVCKAIVDSACDYDASKLALFRGRFSKPVFCGDTIVTRIWRDGADGLIVQADARERGVPVFANAYARLKG